MCCEEGRKLYGETGGGGEQVGGGGRGVDKTKESKPEDGMKDNEPVLLRTLEQHCHEPRLRLEQLGVHGQIQSWDERWR